MRQSLSVTFQVSVDVTPLDDEFKDERSALRPPAQLAQRFTLDEIRELRADWEFEILRFAHGLRNGSSANG